jgi:hypothetical protein
VAGALRFSPPPPTMMALFGAVVAFALGLALLAMAWLFAKNESARSSGRGQALESNVD